MVRHAAASLAIIAICSPGHALAQAASPPPGLEELIPDEAVADPEAWAGAGAPAPEIEPVPEQAAAAAVLSQEIGADAPLDETLLAEIPWPDDGEPLLPEALEPEAGIEFADLDAGEVPATENGDTARASDEVTLAFPTERAEFPERDEFLARYRMLSSVRQLEHDGNVARLGAQARADQKLLERLLRNYGYYDGEIIRNLRGGAADEAPDADEPAVRFEIIPGPHYRFGAVDLGSLDVAGSDYTMLRDNFAIRPGDGLSSDRIMAERTDLDRILGESGYPFAAIRPPSLLIDHERQEGDLSVPVTPGGKYNFGAVVSDLPQFLSSRHLAEIARFEPGDTYQRSLEEDLRRAILATGLVASVALTPVEVAPPAGDTPGTVDMQVALTEAKLRTIAGGIGYGSGEGWKAQVSWEHRNLFPSEGLLRLRAVGGTREQLLGATFRKNNFRGRDRILTIDAYGSTIDNDSYDARTLALTGTYERVSNLLFQKPFSWGIGAEVLATEQAERKARDVVTAKETFLIAALPGHAQIDTSDNLLEPTRGFRLRGAASPELSRSLGKTSSYVKVQFDLSHYQQVSAPIVLAARARAGAIVGSPILDIAPSRRFYAGGGGSVRGYGYHAIGPRDGVGEPNGGRSLVEFSLEARIRTSVLDGAVGVVPFVDAGAVNPGTVPDFSEFRIGAGVGIRYYTPFGPLRVDVGVPLNPGPNDGPVGVYVALGQAF